MTSPDQPSTAQEQNAKIFADLLDKLKNDFARSPTRFFPQGINSGEYYPDTESPGRFVIEAYDSEGKKVFRGADLQCDEQRQAGRGTSLPAARRITGIADAELDARVSAETAWSRAIDEKVPVRLRADALYDLAGKDQRRVTDYVADALSDETCASQWRNTLVFVAEDLQFEHGAKREALAERLLKLARTLRHGAGPNADRVVWSAMRTASSLLRQKDVGRFLEFLDPGGVDTRLVAMQGIVRMLEPMPVSNIPALGQVRGRVLQFAEKLIDPMYSWPARPLQSPFTQCMRWLC